MGVLASGLQLAAVPVSLAVAALGAIAVTLIGALQGNKKVLDSL